jgi:NADP-dependent 3-hydroxy acid dehydrogenase YdfG
MIVTGASSGIGEATARLFASHGYRVVLAARRIERLAALAEDIRLAGGEALPVETDVSHLQEIHRLVQVVLDEYGQIDVLFNNAGFGRLDWFDRLDPLQDIEAMVKVNLLGMMQTARVVLPHMIERGSGHIINMSSIAGFIATPTYTVYAATKYAIRGFTDSLRREVRIWGIHVSGIYPGAVNTEFTEHTGGKRKTGIRTPVRLRLTSEQVAQGVYSLVQRPRRALIQPWMMVPPIWLTVLFPGLSDRIMEWAFVRRERG